jgi:toxin FitB
MIILDTNVISEAMRLSPSPAVLGWLRSTPVFELATTTINVAEIGYGLARLPVGRRRTQLEASFHNFIGRLFDSRIFGFDALAADSFAVLAAARDRSGRPFQRFDGLIAAIASSRGLGVATRNIRGFEDCGVAVVNPWNAGTA